MRVDDGFVPDYVVLRREVSVPQEREGFGPQDLERGPWLFWFIVIAGILWMALT